MAALKTHEEGGQQGGDSSQPRESSWYSEKKLSPKTRELLDSFEPKKGKEQRFYHESPELKARVDRLTEASKHLQAVPVYKLGPVSDEEKLLAWHKAIGSPQRVIDFELQQLKERKAKGGSRR
jgi:hypothetical protein